MIEHANKTVYKITIMLIIITSFMFFLTAKISCDNYFMFIHAKDILQNGFTTATDIVSMHTDMPMTYQKWLLCIIDYKLYLKGGETALKVFHWLIYLIFSFVSYKLYLLNDNNKNRAMIVVLIQTILLGAFQTTRPQIFTYLFLAIELYALEKYIQTSNTKYLWLLPIVSFLEIQLHSTNWPILICFVLPYIVVIPKKLEKHFVKDAYNIKPIIYFTILMPLVALLNPYGYESIIYLLKSLFIPEIKIICGECNPWILTSLIVIVLMLIGTLLMIKQKRLIQSRVLFLAGGTAVLVLSAMRNFPFFVIILPLAISLLQKHNYLKDIKHKNIIFILICILVIYIGQIFIQSNIYQNIAQIKLEKVADYLNDYNNEISSFISRDEDTTSYLAYKSNGTLKPFIDNRLEVYSDKINNQYNYLNEITTSDTLDIIKKYQIDYYITPKSILNDKYILNNSTIIYEDDFNIIIQYKW